MMCTCVYLYLSACRRPPRVFWAFHLQELRHPDVGSHRAWARRHVVSQTAVSLRRRARNPPATVGGCHAPRLNHRPALAYNMQDLDAERLEGAARRRLAECLVVRGTAVAIVNLIESPCSPFIGACQRFDPHSASIAAVSGRGERGGVDWFLETQVR
jgi:hypothetical protein